jgi:hypothetical protein
LLKPSVTGPKTSQHVGQAFLITLGFCSFLPLFNLALILLNPSHLMAEWLNKLGTSLIKRWNHPGIDSLLLKALFKARS